VGCPLFSFTLTWTRTRREERDARAGEKASPEREEKRARTRELVNQASPEREELSAREEGGRVGGGGPTPSRGRHL